MEDSYIVFKIHQVPYNITGWLEKNKDPLNDTVVDQFKKGTNKLVQEIFADHPGQSGSGKDDAGGKGIFVFRLYIKLYIHSSLKLITFNSIISYIIIRTSLGLHFIFFFS